MKPHSFAVQQNAPRNAADARHDLVRYPDGPAPQGDQPGLVALVGFLLDHRWLVAAVTVLSGLLGAGYALTAAPVFRSDAVVQVEDKSKGVGPLDELSGMFSAVTPAQTEMEIIRSRWLLGAAVDDLRLDVQATPRYLPLVGAAVARRRSMDELSPRTFGLGQFAWGGERIQVSQLDVAQDLEGVTFTVVAGGDGGYELLSPQREVLVKGVVGEVARAAAGSITVLLGELRGHAGTEFLVTRVPRDLVIARLKRELQIQEVGKQTGILELSLEGTDRAEITATLNAIAQRYLRQNVERRSEEAEKTLSFLDSQLPALKANLSAAEEALSAYRLKNGSVDVSLEAKGMLDRVVDVEKAVSELEMQRAELRHRFTDNHPALEAVREKLARLQDQRDEADVRMKRLPESELELARLMRDVKVANELYLLLLNRAQELKVVKSGTIGNVRILDNAVVPRFPVSPRKVRVVLFSAVLGFVLGAALAFVKQSLSRGVADPEAVERETGLSVFAAVPRSPRETALASRASKRAPIPVLAENDPDDLAVESLRSLRTSLEFALVDAPSRVLTILGPSPGVGKTFCAVNLAFVLAEQGKRVVLVDADLRKGRLHRYLDGKRQNGLSEVISGAIQLGLAIRRAGENVDIISTGKTPPNPAALLASAAFERIVGELASRYDFVLLDTPPVLAVTDATIVARRAGLNLLVLRAGRHPAREISLAVKRLEQGGAHLHGAIMNDMSTGPGHQRYYYYYGYRKDADV